MNTSDIIKLAERLAQELRAAPNQDEDRCGRTELMHWGESALLAARDSKTIAPDVALKAILESPLTDRGRGSAGRRKRFSRVFRAFLLRTRDQHDRDRVIAYAARILKIHEESERQSLHSSGGPRERGPYR